MNNSLCPLPRPGTLCVVLLALLQCAALAPRSAAQTADEIVAKVLAARGGADKIKAIKSQRITGKISFGADAEGPFFVEFVRPSKMHMEITINGQNIIRVYDGKSSGWVLNPFAPNKDVQPMDADELLHISDEADFDGPLLEYQSKGNHLELLGKDDLDGKQVYKLRLTTKIGDARTYYFDASTFLLMKWEGKRTTEGHEIPIETFFSDYREVNGLKFAFEIDSDSPGSAQQQKITIENIAIDAKIDDTRFAKPSAPAPASAEPASAPPQR